MQVSDSTQAGFEPASSLQRQATVLSIGSDWVKEDPRWLKARGCAITLAGELPLRSMYREAAGLDLNQH